MQDFTLTPDFRRRLWYMIGFLLVVRIFSMIYFPLTDTTEARYGEIARKMLETGNWVTPQHDYGVPFWAKPPLSMWISAISMKLFGVNEFASRLPNLLLSLAMMAMVFCLGKRRENRDYGFLAAALLFSFPLFYVTSGTVMTDTSLAFTVCISFIAFWMAMKQSEGREQKIWGYLFFVGQGLGLLAKGPICGVMTVFPILFWAVIQGNQWRLIWKSFPWFTGILLMLAIALPWYIWAEYRTPGFLDYFIIGEHIKRFLVPGWHGDLYGHAHKQAIGMIWLFWLVGVFPWSVYAVAWLIRRIRIVRKLFKDQDGWALYLFCWMIWPMIFFTSARNIIWPYVITGLAPFALLVVELWHRYRGHLKIEGGVKYRHWVWLPMALPALLIGTVVILSLTGSTATKLSQLALAHKYLELRPSPDSQLYFIYNRYYSAEFYTHGKARYAKDLSVLAKLTTNKTRDFIAIKEENLPNMSEEQRKHFEKVFSFGGVLLLEEKSGAL